MADIGGVDVSESTCTIEGCDRPARCRGWCSGHYGRWRKHGDPAVGPQVLLTPVSSRVVEDRFWANVARSTESDGCWVWTGRLHQAGYGMMTVNRRMVRAHRWAYERLVGAIPAGLELDHLCHTADPYCFLDRECPHRRCVNPAHLEPVTHQENQRRGRSATGMNASKTECVRGHPFSGDNLRIRREGWRICVECDRAYKRAAYARKREQQRAVAARV